ncbi:hypothetical protein HY357_04705 [Candidatus Roizmanbacteria bacterium]|nr:hypothetical protein [Candidatus Roizmanbacteria bacterium]
MKKSYFVLITIFIILVIFGLSVLLSKGQSKSVSLMKESLDVSPTAQGDKVVDHKASFAIFTHGTFRIFTAAMYHNLSEDVFIQADNPNIVHVKKAGTTWDDFFKTLPFKLTKSCLTTGTGETFCNGQNGTLRFYLNGVKTDNLLDTEIQNGDKTLISFGNENEDIVQKQLQQIPVIK